MPDIFTGATSAAGSGQLTNQVLTAYQRSAFFALREETVWDQFARVKPGDLTSPGNPVKFTFWDDMQPATTPLSETVDVDSVALGDSQTFVYPHEYGNAVLVTLRLRTDDFLIGFDSDVSSLINYNMTDTIDALALAAANTAGTTVVHPGATSATDIDSGDNLTAALVRQQRVALRKASVRPWDSASYACIIHPDVAYDLKSQTGDATWAFTATYGDPSRVWNDEIGTFANVRFIETPRVAIDVDGGKSNVDVYTTYFFGQEFLAKAESIPPHIVMGPVTDKLQRFQPLGWHAYLGYGEFRNKASRRVLSSSSIGDN